MACIYNLQLEWQRNIRGPRKHMHHASSPLSSSSSSRHADGGIGLPSSSFSSSSSSSSHADGGIASPSSSFSSSSSSSSSDTDDGSSIRDLLLSFVSMCVTQEDGCGMRDSMDIEANEGFASARGIAHFIANAVDAMLLLPPRSSSPASLAGGGGGGGYSIHAGGHGTFQVMPSASALATVDYIPSCPVGATSVCQRCAGLHFL